MAWETPELANVVYTRIADSAPDLIQMRKAQRLGSLATICRP